MVALAKAMLSEKTLDRFFVDADELAKECHQAYRSAFEETHGSIHAHSGDASGRNLK